MQRQISITNNIKAYHYTAVGRPGLKCWPIHRATKYKVAYMLDCNPSSNTPLVVIFLEFDAWIFHAEVNSKRQISNNKCQIDRAFEIWLGAWNFCVTKSQTSKQSTTARIDQWHRHPSIGCATKASCRAASQLSVPMLARSDR